MGEKRERILRKVHLVLANECRDDRCHSGFFFHTLHLTGVLQKLIDLVKELPTCNRKFFNGLKTYFYPATQ
jgi:hypothetical protein